MNVAVLGASNKKDRYSYQAVMLLKEKGHNPYPVHPVLDAIEGIPVYRFIREIPVCVHTISVYLSAVNQKTIEADILASGASRIIFNPGAENPQLAERFRNSGREALDACTLVLLKTGQFGS